MSFVAYTHWCDCLYIHQFEYVRKAKYLELTSCQNIMRPRYQLKTRETELTDLGKCQFYTVFPLFIYMLFLEFSTSNYIVCVMVVNMAGPALFADVISSKISRAGTF